MSKTLAAIALLLACLVSLTARAENVVSHFVGEWTGNGTARANGIDQPERIRCRVVGTQMSDVQISFEGQCATTSGSGRFRLLLAQDPSGQAFAATVKSSTSKTEHQFSGSRTGSTITLLQKTPVQTDTRLVSSEITLNLPNRDQIELINLLSDLNEGTRFKALSILYQRQ